MVKTLTSSAGGVGSIPGWGAEIPHASQPKNQNMKQKQYCNTFNKDLKNITNREYNFHISREEKQIVKIFQS